MPGLPEDPGIFPSKQEVLMEANFDDGGKIWLNDKPAYSGYGKGLEKVNIHLQAGWNTLLSEERARIPWGWSAKVHCARADGGPIAGLQYKAE